MVNGQMKRMREREMKYGRGERGGQPKCKGQMCRRKGDKEME